jgi:hypothetical protein
MNDDSDFFGEVFEDPDDDPLLGGEESGSEAPDSTEDSSEKGGPPSWMSEGQENGEASGSTSGKENGPPKKEILIEQGSSEEGIQQINEAIGEGWKLVRISLGQPDGEQASTQREARRFVATLEQDSPQSLFEFG